MPTLCQLVVFLPKCIEQHIVLFGAQGRNRTADTRIFSFVIFQRVILLRIGRVRAHLFHPVILIRFITFFIVSRWHGCCTANVLCTLAMTVMGVLASPRFHDHSHSVINETTFSLYDKDMQNLLHLMPSKIPCPAAFMRYPTFFVVKLHPKLTTWSVNCLRTV